MRAGLIDFILLVHEKIEHSSTDCNWPTVLASFSDLYGVYFSFQVLKDIGDVKM